MDVDTKTTILKTLAENEGVSLPDDVLRYIATWTPANSRREVEGSLIRVIAYASLTRQEITISFVDDVLNKITNVH